MAHESAMDAVGDALGGAWVSILVAFVAYFLVSFLWWGPLFGKKWAAEMGMEDEEMTNMTVPLILQAIASFLVVYVFWNVSAAFFVEGVHGGAEAELAVGEFGIGMALMGAFMTWLGFFLPGQLGRVAWEKASWTLAGINAAGHLVALVVAATVFAFV